MPALTDSARGLNTAAKLRGSPSPIDSGACYLFGYGSLISKDSRERTAPSADWQAVSVIGLQRYWSVLVDHADYCAVAIKPVAQARCNGVLFRIDQADLPAFDERERAYRRVSIAPSQLRAAESLPDAPIWAYVLDQPTPPSAATPIVQSYVDVILEGALQISAEFAIEFIEHTQYWSPHWLDDRVAPRYLRPSLTAAQLPELSRLLRRLQPDCCPASVRAL